MLRPSRQLGSLLMLSAAFTASAQSPALTQQPGTNGAVGTVQLSPGMAYREALRPLEITRRSIANWSETEQAALAVGVRQAAAACGTRPSADYFGDALVDLSHLCAMGQTWPAVLDAAGRYIKEDSTPKLRLAEAYAAELDAELHLKSELSALQTAKQMVKVLPYNSLVADATSEALDYMQLLYTADAVSLATLRQPKILTLLHGSLSTDAAGPAPSLTSDIPTVPQLYRQALALAQLQQLAGNSMAAHSTVVALDDLIPVALSNDDRLAIQAARLRYLLLGQPLKTLALRSSLNVPALMPDIPAHRAITALLLIPDWCAQCVRLARQMPETVFSVEGHEAYLYALLAQTVPPKKLPKSTLKHSPAAHDDSFDPAYAAEYLKGTATVTVAPTLLDDFNATDVPLLIVTDSHGVVRFIENVDESALQPGNTVDSAVALIGRLWRSTASAPNPPATSRRGTP